MRGRGSARGSQASCCGGDWRVTKIQIGGVTIGIMGLREVLEQVYRLGRQPGPEAAEELLAMVKAQNWVERNSEQDYKDALLREYAAYCEAKAGAEGLQAGPGF